MVPKLIPGPRVSSAVGAIILSITYGYDASESDNKMDPLVKLAETGMDLFSKATTPGAFFVDYIPWCEFVIPNDFPHLLNPRSVRSALFFEVKYLPACLPGMGFRRKAVLWRKMVFDMVEVPYQFTKSQLVRLRQLPVISPRSSKTCRMP